jgi:hypothetical protein
VEFPGFKDFAKSLTRDSFTVRFLLAAAGCGVGYALREYNAGTSYSLAAEMVVSGLVYFGLGKPLHGRATAALARRTLDRFAILSLASSAFYGFSTLVAMAWTFFPRFFPLRWLEEDLTVRTYFLEAAVLVTIGLLSLAIRTRLE